MRLSPQKITFINSQISPNIYGNKATKRSFSARNVVNQNTGKKIAFPKAVMLLLIGVISSGTIVINKAGAGPKGNLFAEDLTVKAITSKPDKCNVIIDKDLLLELEKLAKKGNVKQSYYYDYYGKLDNSEQAIAERRFEDYKALAMNVPDSIMLGGVSQTKKYMSDVVSIIQNCGEYGAFYIKNIPDRYNMAIHASCIRRLSDAAKEIQGCKYENIAILNGLSAQEVMQKVVIPNEKIAQGEIIGKNQRTLIMITNEYGKDTEGAFIDNYSTNVFSRKDVNLEYKNYTFDESFLGHYDNIILIQPTSINADDALNSTFKKLEKTIDFGADVDIAYMAHSSGDGITLSNIYKTDGKNQVNRLDLQDFNPIEAGGQPFTQGIKRIFKNSIANGYNPRFIAMGCDSDKLQVFFKEFDGKVHIFGTPFDNNDKYVLGFNNNSLVMASKSSRFYKNYGLLYAITELKIKLAGKFLNSFSIDKGLENGTNPDLDRILLDDLQKGKTGGIVEKENGMTMIYDIKQYKN